MCVCVFVCVCVQYIYIIYTIDLVSINPVVITLDNILDDGVGVEVDGTLHLAPVPE